MIIGGFLGSGKTTTILKIIRQLSNAGRRLQLL
nr:GTP-binding protein [Methanosarcina barkeri]